MKMYTDVLLFNRNTKVTEYTGTRDNSSIRKLFSIEDLPRRVAETESGKVDEDESDNVQGEGMKFVLPSNIIGVWIRLEVSLGLKLSRHTDTLTEAGNLMDDLLKILEIRSEQQNKNPVETIYAF